MSLEVEIAEQSLEDTLIYAKENGLKILADGRDLNDFEIEVTDDRRHQET